MWIGQLDNFILDTILSRAAQGNIATLLRTNEAFQNLFEHHASAILRLKILRHQTGNNRFLTTLERILTEMASLDGHLGAKQHDDA
jgi:phage gp37-like protein